MGIRCSVLTISLAILAASGPATSTRADTRAATRTSVQPLTTMNCGSSFEAFGRNSSRALDAEKIPPLDALKKDLPLLRDPVGFIQEFNHRRSAWNDLNPQNRNNFPMPEMSGGVKQLLTSLQKIKRPPENRLLAEKFIRELKELEARAFPYRDSILKTHEALTVVAAKHPLTLAQAQNRAGGRLTPTPVDLEKFLKENEERRRSLEAMTETEIFIPTARPQSIEGLAESFVLGLRPLQIAERAENIDFLNMTALHRLEHDIAHIAIQQQDPVNRSIAQLPFEKRLEILSDIYRLKTERERHLVRFGLFQTAHEWGNDSFIPRIFQKESIEKVREEYREKVGGEVTATEVRWLQEWYRDVVGLRIYENQRLNEGQN